MTIRNTFRKAAIAVAALALFSYTPAGAAPAATTKAKPAAAAGKAAAQPVRVAQADTSAGAPDGRGDDASAAYTGLIIDARPLPDIMRSPAPSIYGPSPDTSLLYPDRSHVPTPDEVQDNTVVRYYHTEAEARAGVGGSNPLILPASAVLGPAKDALQLDAADMQRLMDLDKQIHFTQTWKVGFLIPENQ